jgi:ribonuclease E
MEQRMLINAVHPEECRIAIVEGSTLAELEIESNVGKKAKGNIYRGRISRIEPSLQAAFVDIGTSRNGFLQINDVHPSCFRDRGQRGGKVRIQDVLEAGQELVVQVVKEERDMKGATLTTYISLPGRYLVIMPGSERAGISRKIHDNEQRLRLSRLSRELEVPVGIGMIIRTAGLDRSQSELSRDLSLQLKLWEGILTANQSAKAPALLYKDNDLTTRVIRDYFTPDVREILIDDPKTFSNVREFVGQVMPRYRSRIKLYEEKGPIFTHHGIDQQVQDALSREVKLPSGGAIVIEQLEALVAIDVNSGKATEGANIEETAFRTNLEAAEEVARQLRLRDLGGLVVIDFIDMSDKRHRASVERKLQDCVSSDKARIELGKLSKFGLLEMSRQRLRSSLISHSHVRCEHCLGNGQIKNPELVALEALRKIQAAVIVGHVAKVKARLPSMPAFFLLNNKRAELSSLETQHGVQILILPDGRLRPDEYEFEMEGIKDHHSKSAHEVGTDSSTDSTSDESREAQKANKAKPDESGDKQRGKRANSSARQPAGDAAL